MEALRAAKDADFLIILFDAIQGIKKTEKEIFDELKELGKPFIIALNKIDLVKVGPRRCGTPGDQSPGVAARAGGTHHRQEREKH